MPSFHDIMRGTSWQIRIFAFLLGIAEANAFFTFKKYNENAQNISHFDFKQQLAHEMIHKNYSITENSLSGVITRSQTNL
jgi:hypothetical protein